MSNLTPGAASAIATEAGSFALADRTLLSAATGRTPGAPAPDLVAALAGTAARRREHRAVEASDASLSYADLERLSNRLANRLLSLGVGRDACVGVSLPRGAGELVALLATAKAGGAYVPLDPAHPTDRLRLILEDAAPQVMIVHPSSPLAEGIDARAVIVLDDLLRATEGFSATAPPLSYHPDQLAYVLFTSGSTGRPKGVEISRGAFANFLRSMTVAPGLAETDRLLAVSTTSFDIAGLELFLPLYVGATVVIADRESVVDPRRLRRRVETDEITVMQATPATWRLLLEAGWQSRIGLRMLCGGEAMSASLADRLLAGGGELWNMYGPTETTVWSTLERIDRLRDVISIGRPIDCTQIYILDDQHKLLPAGTVGELYIGGLGLARGYRGRPDLTAERFIQNPGGPPGDRIYRTGDLGRMLPDGRFECLGRIDHQVKIRGFRIELGEIESVLRQVPRVKEVLVLAEDRGGDPRLVAYWVGEAPASALVEAARRRLPAYMVPASYISLAAFPLTPNGKIDRKALPRSDVALADAATPLKGPRNDAETRMEALWREVLDLPHVGVDQDFFTLGGTSVSVVELRARIERDLGVDLPLPAFFDAPTIEKLAALLHDDARAFSPDAPIIVDLRKGDPSLEPWFCLLGVQIYHDLAKALPDRRPVVGMHVPFRHLRGLDPRPTVPVMAAGYIKHIRERQPHGPYLLAGLCYGGVVAFEAARQLEMAGEEVALVAVFDGMLPRALHIDHVGRVIANLRAVIEQPRQLVPMARKKLTELACRVPYAGPILKALTEPVSIEPIDVPIDGPEADAEIERYQSSVQPIAGRLLVLRATDQGWPDWLTSAPDLGWTGLATEVAARDLATPHLDLLKQPHVKIVADAMVAAASERARPDAASRAAG
jgi:amino acid adenylation domain-containing protein